MIRVVKVNKLRIPEERAGVVYVGRTFAGWNGHPLANPFRVRPHDRNQDRGTVVRTVEEALDRYRGWLDFHPQRDALLSWLWDATGHGKKPLGCWCCNAVVGDGTPIRCHAQILAEMLAERYATPTA